MTLPVIFTLLGGLPGCGPADDRPSRGNAEDAPLRVTATIGMIADAAERVGGERVEVTGLMGPGIDPHLYRASAGDVRTLADSDIVLYNGLHLEAAMGEVLEEMEGRITTVPVAEAVPEERLLGWPAYPGQYDPHIWFDVELWRYAVERVRDALIEKDPAGEAEYRAHAQAYLEELERLDAEVRERVATIPEERRILVTAHDAFQYFGRAYGFEVRGLLGISSASEAGTGDVQELADYIAERRIPAIFVETSIPRRTLEAVQAAVRSRGFRVEIGEPLFSDAMGDPGTDAGTYPGMVRHNVESIVQGLGDAP
ncbi:MAG: zinc ABC transporter substrate-binding protein [Gemmatimonadota bacterium]|nr:zinc ABC transporter substrate-binding protein [Gemmatimonadota bacterium]